jgi:uncharacterized protein with von Willebrand factor type A (vWA) domain
MVDVLSGFVGELRAAGLPVSMTEHLDAMAALAHVPLEDREAFKYALGATLVKNDAHLRLVILAAGGGVGGAFWRRRRRG